LTKNLFPLQKSTDLRELQSDVVTSLAKVSGKERGDVEASEDFWVRVTLVCDENGCRWEIGGGLGGPFDDVTAGNSLDALVDGARLQCTNANFWKLVLDLART
jgi:hypothetical protein